MRLPVIVSLLEGGTPNPPFSPTVTIPIERARAMPFFQDNYWGNNDAQWRRVDTDWLGAASDLALAMQSATNNTSLVLAIEFANGDVLLFAGDAQVGNWLSWQDRKWNVNGREVTGPELLTHTIFYKVGHHGSHNATLKAKGLEMMQGLKTAAIPVLQALGSFGDAPWCRRKRGILGSACCPVLAAGIRRRGLRAHNIAWPTPLETGGSATGLSVADAWHGAAVGDESYVSLIRTVARRNFRQNAWN